MLVTISETRGTIRFRYRIVGEMWYQNFVRVLKVTEQGIILNDEIKNRLYSLPDLSSIIQFELDGSIYMMYLGNQVGRHGFGLAVLEGGL